MPDIQHNRKKRSKRSVSPVERNAGDAVKARVSYYSSKDVVKFHNTYNLLFICYLDWNEETVRRPNSGRISIGL